MFYIIAFQAFILYQIYNYIKWYLIVPKFTGKTVLITGGSSGLGEELAKRFIKNGAE